ncbi:hypothetical protein ABES38_08960 [Bacillus gobiensis]|uniref:hypothetical protein n=1 Tax=Bacillus gobiensis TaxID=1441095 RepID=UPI003D1BFE0B
MKLPRVPVDKRIKELERIGAITRFSGMGGWQMLSELDRLKNMKDNGQTHYFMIDPKMERVNRYE